MFNICLFNERKGEKGRRGSATLSCTCRGQKQRLSSAFSFLLFRGAHLVSKLSENSWLQGCVFSSLEAHPAPTVLVQHWKQKLQSPSVQKTAAPRGRQSKCHAQGQGSPAGSIVSLQNWSQGHWDCISSLTTGLLGHDSTS